MKINIKNRNCRATIPAEKPYGDWSIRNDITEYALAENTTEYDSLSISFNPDDGDKLFLVKGVYSTGDSFGTETGVVEYLDIFKTYGEAILFKEKIDLFNEYTTKDWYGFNPKQKADKIRDYKYRLKDNLKENKSWGGTYIFIYNGKECHFPWGGYFERLSSIEIVELEFKGEIE